MNFQSLFEVKLANENDIDSIIDITFYFLHKACGHTYNACTKRNACGHIGGFKK